MTWWKAVPDAPPLSTSCERHWSELLYHVGPASSSIAPGERVSADSRRGKSRLEYLPAHAPHLRTSAWGQSPHAELLRARVEPSQAGGRAVMQRRLTGPRGTSLPVDS